MLEIARGNGRHHAERAASRCSELVLTDTSAEALTFAAARLRERPQVRTVLSADGFTVPLGEDGTFTAVYSYDAMVHPESACVASYLAEAAR